MIFKIPRGQSMVVHFDVYPKEPDANGDASEWEVINTTAKPSKKVDYFDIRFKKKSTPQQRQSERLIMVFTMAQKPNRSKAQPKHSWRFVHGGVMYCEGRADYRDDLAFEMSADGTVLTATAKALTDGDEEFQFAFLGLCRDNKSGICTVYSSADPGGKVGRDD